MCSRRSSSVSTVPYIIVAVVPRFSGALTSAAIRLDDVTTFLNSENPSGAPPVAGNWPPGAVQQASFQPVDNPPVPPPPSL